MYFRVVYLFTFKYIHARFHSINLRLIRKVLMNIHRGGRGGPFVVIIARKFHGGETKRYFLESSLSKLCRIFIRLDKIRTSRKIFVNLN